MLQSLNQSRTFSQLKNILHLTNVSEKSLINSLKNYLFVTLDLVQIGDPVLRAQSDPIPEDLIKSREVIHLLNTLEKVRRNFNLVGISAPQVGVNLRVFLACFDENAMKKFKPPVQKAKELSIMPLQVFINPELKIVDHRKVIFEEACGSVMGMAADVARCLSVEVTALDEEGKKFTKVYSGWNARILQHENDHLNGILFTDLMEKKTLRNTNWEMVNRKAGRIEVPFYPK